MPPTIVKRLKRPRSDYDIPGGHDLPSYFSREDKRGPSHVSTDSDALGASYDRYLDDIFRPFVGYKEVWLVTKDSKHSGSCCF